MLISILSKMIDVKTAAKYLIRRYEQESGSVMDEMKLHKLLYFTQRESFILLGKPMFLEKFEAWKYGPVMRCLRNAHWECGAHLPVDSEYIPVLEDTLRRYAQMDSLIKHNNVNLAHAEIANFLRTNANILNIHRIGDTESNDIFGNKAGCAKWGKFK